MQFSNKQLEFWKNANCRWNIKSGATRSGKTYLDYFVIAKRIRALQGKAGLIVIFGNTKETIERNILEPMREIYGEKYVGTINNSNKVKLFGRSCYALGAEKITQTNKIRGSSIAYAYCDEVVTYHQDVFNMLKSRLDKPYSKCDLTCNPENQNHWFKKFIDSDADIYYQQYTLDDNIFLSEDFKNALKKEYAGTVLYRRYIKGEWCNAEGLLFQQYADDIKRWEIDALPHFAVVNIGVDIGGTKSHSTLVATGITPGFKKLVTFAEHKIIHAKGTIDTNMIIREIVKMIKLLNLMGYDVKFVLVDNAEQVILNSITAGVRSEKLTSTVTDCKKIKGSTRILYYNLLLNTDRLFFYKVPIVSEALSTAMYDEKKKEDTILDDFTTDIDTFDAQFYSFSIYLDYLSLKV